MKILLTLILAIMPLAAQTQGGTINWVHLPGQGYRITHTETHPGAIAGSELIFTSTAHYTDETGAFAGEASSDDLILLIGPTTWRKEWIYIIPPGVSAIVDHDSGNGGVEIEAPNQIKAFITLPNDGNAHVFSWRLVLRP